MVHTLSLDFSIETISGTQPPSALIHRHIVTLALTNVDLTRTPDLGQRVDQHLTVLLDPTRNPTKGKEWGGGANIEGAGTKQAINQSDVKINVRIQVT